MATNNNGNLLDDAGNVAIDFVWGNFPIQPNDDRPDAASATLSTTVTTRVAGRLDPEADNHIIALSGWNGFPLYNPNTAGEDVVGDAVDYVLVPNVIGLTTALATDAMKDASLVPTTAAAATNAAKTITAASRTAGSNTLVLTVSSHGFSVGQIVVISNTGDASANGTWAVLAGSSGNTLNVGTTPTTAVALTGITGSVVGLAGTIKTQSVAAAANEIAPGAAVTITPFATAS
jgi:hypothetical protein